MSTATRSHGFLPRVIQLGSLLVVFGLVYAAIHTSPRLEAELGTVAGVGFLLLAGTLLSELLEPFGLPHLSGYLLAGVVGGPHVLHLVDHATVEQLSPVNTLALALIALAGGAELRADTLRQVAVPVVTALALQCGLGLFVMGGLFLAFSSMIPFVSGLDIGALVGVSLLWGVLAVSRSPSACLAILSQTRAKGPLTTFSLAFVMASDVVVLLLMASAMMVARPLITPGGTISLEDFNVLGHEVVGSVALGTTLGLLLIVYLKLVERNLLLVLLALGFGMTEFLRYVHIDPLLTFLTAGFVVQNLSEQGHKLLHAVENTGSIVYVVFFATAGAHLDLPLLVLLWPIALGLSASRGVVTYAMARWSSAIAKDSPQVRTWGFSSMVSQAGLTLGLSVVVARTFPEFGEQFRSLVIATVAINEVVGPILFKVALDRTGETHAGAAPMRRSAPDIDV